jgi:phosphoglycolate phosphatase
MTSTVFFDLDGTLTDPREGITGSIRYALARMGVEAPAGDDLTWCIGPPLLESLAELVGPRHAPEALGHYRERFSAIGLFENSVYAGVPEMLSRLAAAGLTLFVASSKPLVFVRRIVDHFALNGHFDELFGAGLDGTRSDKSALLAHALVETGVDPTRAVMVGDRAHDVRGALANGLDTVGVLYGYGGRDELVGAGARWLAAGPEHLVDLLVERPGSG